MMERRKVDRRQKSGTFRDAGKCDCPTSKSCMEALDFLDLLPGIIAVLTDPDGTIRYINEGFRKMVGEKIPNNSILSQFPCTKETNKIFEICNNVASGIPMLDSYREKIQVKTQSGEIKHCSWRIKLDPTKKFLIWSGVTHMSQ